MNADANEAVEAEEGLAVTLPPHLTANFEKAEEDIRRYYGLSPGVPALVRLWVSRATSSQVRKAFELAVLDMKHPGLRPDELRYFDDDEF